MIRKRRSGTASDGLVKLVQDTHALVDQLVKENRALRARNARLAKDLERVSSGWEEIRRLARTGPRRPRARRGR